ncbi:metal ABC transporter solute-binding protein, Zn/Mn family [Aneurinibacillus aneurinilyticus]|uniref:Zinc ABC transporter solute-binding protein n=1 Tax=Aneurinibacillus aneurinilyticus TaxID=1391 RepID=A0A848CY91_ANEAE|nr:zinc ABC transporter substrate-binding protein [Aneurinibacillus aneurinilyticus]MCI1695786.1 zinc ABC transporter substrate-binding protein [Aneurinibacillus aneurinilyticus]MED0672587.1 zinc ABC transporter substrate-binding protein [Aneurinibacillus aneurinilyticus]NME98797.1 zinc ABC transporter solute-binding protein [Aneurinibacillus aneurinilyticus]
MKGYYKILYGLLTISIVFSIFLAGCGQKETIDQKQITDGSQKIKVYTTLFPLYDFVRTIGGEHVKVSNLLPPGAEAHDYEPSAKDIGKVNEARLFIYNGAGYEAWIDNMTKNLDVQKTKVVDASRGLQLVESDKHEEEHAHKNGEAHEEHEGHSHGKYDPHVWLNPQLAKQQAANIQKGLTDVDPAHKAEYEANYNKLAQQLDALDKEYKDAIAKAKKKEFVVSHKAFTYMAEHYGLEQLSVSGLTPSEEPTQQQLKHLIDTLKEHNIKYVAFEELVENKVAKTVQREAGAEAVTLYTLENLTKEQFNAGKTYTDIMKENLTTLKKVLEVQ